MTLVKWHRNNEDMPVLSNFFENFLDNDVSNDYANSCMNKVPAANIIETKDDFKIELAVPGLSKKDFKINLEKHLLTIEVSTEVKNEENEERFTRREFSYSSFQRSFRLPNSVDPGKIDAKYSNGVLNLIIPKREEAKDKPAMEIKVS